VFLQIQINNLHPISNKIDQTWRTSCHLVKMVIVMKVSNWIVHLYKILQKRTNNLTFRNINAHILIPSSSSIIPRELQYAIHWEHPPRKAQWYQHQLLENVISSSQDDFYNTRLVNPLGSYRNHRQIFELIYSNASILKLPYSHVSFDS